MPLSVTEATSVVPSADCRLLHPTRLVGGVTHRVTVLS
jgi:hypothetical protein